jgi:hypothetical protein
MWQDVAQKQRHVPLSNVVSYKQRVELDVRTNIDNYVPLLQHVQKLLHRLRLIFLKYEEL